MARLVKCKYCGISFDRDIEEWATVGNRYAHSSCIAARLKSLEQRKQEEELERTQNITQYHEVLDFAKNNIENPNYALIQKQIRDFIDNKGYSYSGILKSLVFFYEVKHNNIEQSKGGIGIVPYVYENAYNYYYNLWLAKQKNKDVEVEQYTPKVKEIVIPRPQRKVKKRPLFTFLDED